MSDSKNFRCPVYFFRVTFFAAAWSLCCLSGCSAPSDSQVISQADQVNGTLAPAIENNGDVNNYLTAMGHKIQDAAKQLDSEHVGPKSHFNATDDWMFQPDVEFHLVNSKTLNAFTTGGKHVYVYNQLLQTCSKEEDLAAVISHEFAHIYCRHVASGMQRSQKQQYLALAAGGAGYVAGGQDSAKNFATYAMAAGQYIGMGYTRKDEAQADEFGFQFYVRAGWDPNAFGDFFQTMINQGYDKTPEEMSDHPTLASRVTKAKEYASKLPPSASKYRQNDIYTPSQFNQLKQTAQQVAATTPNDESLKQAQNLLGAFPSCVTPTDSPEQKSAQELIYSLTGTKPPAREVKNSYVKNAGGE